MNNPGVYALAGVLLTAVAGWIGAGLQRRWSRKDAAAVRAATEAAEREKRLFDHRLDAYNAVASAMDAAVYNMVEPGTYELRRAPVDPDPSRELVHAIDRVRLLGSKDVGVAASAARQAMDDLADALGDDQATVVRKLQEAGMADHELVNAMRRDLVSGGDLPLPVFFADGNQAGS